MLELLSVQEKIFRSQQLIRVYVEETRTSYAGEAPPPPGPLSLRLFTSPSFAAVDRQSRQLFELLKKKVSELNEDEENMELSKAADQRRSWSRPFSF